MQSKSVSDLVRPRTFSTVLVFAAMGLITAGALLGILRSEAASKVSQRTLTFAERVTYQRAIEEVYWRHRIWPKENLNPKPSLDAVISQAQLEKKVTDYLRNSQALEDYWQFPITANQLQAEMDRMAKNTKQPDVLRELFDALGNDSFLVAECLARPVLSERLITSFAQEQRKDRLALCEVGVNIQTQNVILANTSYVLPTISDATTGCTPDTWVATSTTNAPDARVSHTAVWTGSEMIIWGGAGNGGALNTGGRYNPATDSWTATSTIDAPSARNSHTAVWTGTEMIVWGGSPLLNTGGKYNPNTDSWAATSITSAPDARFDHTAVWTGTEMIVWGGADASALNTGGRYDPVTDSWTATSIGSAPAQRYQHTAVWSGSEMIVWGGTDSISYLNTGGRYNPSMDSWTETSTTSAPSGRDNHTAVWTGDEMIVWGGFGGAGGLRTGGRYDPATNSWTATGITNAPAGRESHTAVWTGSEMIVWGGCCYFNTGGRYDPAMDSWVATSTTNAPAARYSPTGVWTGTQMIVWGGSDDAQKFNTGGRYCAQSGASSPTPTATATPTVTPTPTTTASPTSTPTATGC